MDLHDVRELLPAAGPADWRPGDAWLAGGTWLFSQPQPDVERLLDLTAAGWPALTVTAEGLEIAATCTVAELDRAARDWPADWLAAPLVGQCCAAFLASFKVQNVATVGGNLCLGLPAGPMISLTAALDGACTVQPVGAAQTTIAVADLVVGAGRTALRPGDLLRAIHLPAAALRCRTAFRQASLSPAGRSAALLVGRLEPGGGLALTLTAATVRPVRVAFAAMPTAAELRAAVDAAVPAGLVHDDVHGAPAWRRHLAFELAEQIRAELACG